MTRAPRADLALDSRAVATLLAEPVSAWAGFRPAAADPEVLKRTERRLVVRYRLTGSDGAAELIGKWFSTDRGAIIDRALRELRARGFAGGRASVPEPVAYLPDARALFTAVVEGPLLREALRSDGRVAAAAGAWLAAFHRSGMPSERSCGPAKMRRAVARWAEGVPPLEPFAAPLDAALGALPDPRLPVVYDYYHSQAIVTRDGLAVLDFDEAGLGDPAFDVAHFLVHLRLLAQQWFGATDGFAGAEQAFAAGYAAVAPLPPARPALEAFAAFKLARQALDRDAPAAELAFLLDALSAGLR